MCGLCGFTDAGRMPSPDDVLDRILSCLTHRGPDAEGRHVNQDIALGHMRLSVIDLSAAGNQPMRTADGRYIIVYNGEVYNFQILRSELERTDSIRWVSATDTEVLLYAYRHWGADCLKRLRGEFALAVWDEQDKTLFLARDRLGVKPLYYAPLPGGHLAFASEVRALIRHPRVDHSLLPRAIDEYLTYLYVPAPLTIYAGVRELLPGQYLVWKDGVWTTHDYWKPPTRAGERLTEEDAVAELNRLLAESVRLQMVADVPLGAFLSGGIDSSSVVAYMCESASAPIHTFTVGFEGAGLYDEREQARLLARHFGTDHREIIVRPDCVDLLPRVVRHFGQPFGNPTSMLTYLLAEKTREHVTVALAGDGGDEVFGGYPRYMGALWSDRYRKLPGLLRHRLLPGIARMMPESARGFHQLRRVREFVFGNRMPARDMYRYWVGYYTEDAKSALYTPEFKAQLDGADAAAYMDDLFGEAEGLEPFAARARYVDFRSFLPCNVLQYGDRMSMAHGLELRVPLLDHKIVEFMMSLPFDLCVRNGTQKYLLRRAMARRLPGWVLRRRKLGFNPPMGQWIVKELREVVADYLSEGRLRQRGIFEATAVSDIVAQHGQGQRDFSLHIWALLVLEEWMRQQEEWQRG